MSLEKAVLDAAKTNQVEDLRATLYELARAGTPAYSIRDQFGSTPLHWAAAKGHVEAVTLLLEQGIPATVRYAMATHRPHTFSWFPPFSPLPLARLFPQ